jgi:hypothetical protein
VPGPCGEEHRPRLQPTRTTPFKHSTMNSTLRPCLRSLPWRLVLCLAVLTGAAGGCGKQGKKNEVSGKVVLVKKNGATQDVTGGIITFHPGSGPPYPGTIKPDGTFDLTGVPPGKMRVTVETERLKNQTVGYTMPKKAPKDVTTEQPELETSERPKYVKVPALYAKPDTTKLTCEITEGKNEFTFDLKE